jgi:PAS domain S-box-containing protein
VWIGGHRPGILVALVGYLACAYLFIPPRGQVALNDVDLVVGLIAYLFTCALIVGIGEAMRSAQGRANEQRRILQVTLSSIGDAVITTDNGGRITYLNPVAESLTGWLQRDALGQALDTVFRIVNEETRQPVSNPAERALREGVIVGLANHTVLVRRDGSELPIDDSAAPITDEAGHVAGCVLIFRDVTEQRRLQRERTSQLQSARLLAAIVESSDDAIISKSLDGIIQSWNAGAERLFGYTPAEAVGRHISLVIPVDRIAEEDEIIASLKAGKPIEHFETERLRSDGELFQVSLTISPIKDDAGNVVGASKIVRDITDRKRVEADREKFVAQLADADRRKDEFLAMLAHELRNPLAPMSSAVQVLRLGAGDRQAVHSASEMLERQVGHMGRLVDDLLDMSRITRGKIELRKERAELGAIIDHAVEASRVLCRSMDHELTVTMPKQPIYVNADPTRIAQVVGNLLNNACKFTDRGGRILLGLEREGEQAVIRVKDNGIGIAVEQIPRLFEMFTQLDTSLERSRDGLGIGLTLVKTLVELHDGTVEVHSDGPGHGSEFVVRLPVLLAEPKPLSSSTQSPSRSGTGRRVLIVDDNEDGALSLAMLLRLDGHDTHTAHDGVEALAAAERLRPDAVLLDIGLPGLNGYEVCRRIREQPWGKDLVLVALTGWGQEEDRHRSTAAGFDMHLVKPVDRAALAGLLASLSPTGNAG